MYNKMNLQRPRTIEGDAGFEPGTSAPEVLCSTIDPPHFEVPAYLIEPPYLFEPPHLIEPPHHIKATTSH